MSLSASLLKMKAWARPSIRRNELMTICSNRTQPPAAKFTSCAREVGVSWIFIRQVSVANLKRPRPFRPLGFGSAGFRFGPRFSFSALESEGESLEGGGTGMWRVLAGPGSWSRRSKGLVGWGGR
jgi:hypothetical protein